MSAVGQVLAQVRDLVEGLLAQVHSHDAAQDKRLDAVEARLDALEKPQAATSAAPAAKSTQTVRGKAQGSQGSGGTRS